MHSNSDEILLILAKDASDLDLKSLKWPDVSLILSKFTHSHIAPQLYLSSGISSNVLGIYCCINSDVDSKLLPTLLTELSFYLGPNIQIRRYKAISSPGNTPLQPFTQFSKEPHFLVVNCMTPLPTADQDFNSWYLEEHLPLLRRVPSWLSSRRFCLVSTTSQFDTPQYLALHQWGALSAFVSAEFKAATNTPWRTEVMRNITARERIVLEYRGTIDTSVLY